MKQNNIAKEIWIGKIPKTVNQKGGVILKQKFTTWNGAKREAQDGKMVLPRLTEPADALR